MMKIKPALAVAVVLLFCTNIFATLPMPPKKESKIKIPHLSTDLAVSDLTSEAWNRAVRIVIIDYWTGQKAPKERHFTTHLLWSDTAFYIKFDADQKEPLITAAEPDVSKKTLGLWNRDVCEIFIAPDRADRTRYFEFEVAPTGEWVDLGIHWSPQERKTDLEYSSRMESAALIEPGKIVMAIKIPWKAFGKAPKSGDVWLGNLFRCVGKDPTRGYLAWQPTKTAKPNFHVPSKFGQFEFVSEPAA